MTFVLLGIGFALGLLARQSRSLPTGTSDWINGFVMNIALPAMIVLRMHGLELNRTALVPIALAWCVILSSALLVIWLSRRLRWPPNVTGAMLLIVPLGNTAYLGLPLIDAFTDGAALPYAILYDQIGNFVGVAIYATVIVAIFSHHSANTSAIAVVKKILLFPPFVAAMIALALPAGALPAIALPPLKLLATTMGPMAMIIVGLQLELSVPPTLRRAVAAACCIKLVLAPLLVAVLALALNLRGPAVEGALLQSAMPPMITAGLIGMAAGFSRSLIIAVTGIASVLGIISLPLVFYIAAWFGG